MRLADDIRKCVVFFGSYDGTTFKSAGTGFLLTYQRIGYLVTASHNVEAIGDDPLHIRVNATEGKPSFILTGDRLLDDRTPQWFCSHDRSVDLAIMPFQLNLARGLDVMYLEAEAWSERARATDEVGCGQACYAVGLFRLHEGSRRNLPVVHTGNVAMLPSREDLIPTKTRTTPVKLVEVEGYLVTMTSLDGLSGSPVFVRHEVQYEGLPPAEMGMLQIPHTLCYLLGVWQGSFEGDPDPNLGKRVGERVAVGMGIVTPVERLIELFERPDVVEARNELIEKIRLNQAATQD